MSGHPHYRGVVLDMHCHADGQHLDQAAAALAQAGMGAWLNLWNTEWPPPPFLRWRAEVAGNSSVAMGLGHAPDLSPIGSEGFANDLEASIRAAAEEGAAALKVWKNLGLTLRDAEGQLVAVDDSRLDVLWRTAAEVELPVVIHIADPVAFFAPLDSRNERLAELQAHPDWWFGAGNNPSFLELITQLDNVLARHGETVFIGAHMGCYAENLARVAEMLDEHQNYFVDTSARVAEIGRDDPQRVHDFFVDHADRILFGSDFSRTRNLMLPEQSGLPAELEFFERYWRFFETDETGLEHPIPVQGAWKICGIGLPDAVLEKLYRSNAERVLPRLTAPVLRSDAR